jgi:hypothetical protein
MAQARILYCPCASQRSFMISSQAKIRPCYFLKTYSDTWLRLCGFHCQKTKQSRGGKFIHPSAQKDVEKYVETCPVQGLGATRHKTSACAEISVSFITGLPPSIKDEMECNVILTIVDRYSKMAIFLPVQDTINATEMAELFHSEMQCRFGPRFEIISGRDLTNGAKL